MWDKLIQLIPVLKTLMDWCKNLFIGALLIRQGEQNNENKQNDKKLDDAVESAETRSRIESLPDDDLDKLL